MIARRTMSVAVLALAACEGRTIKFDSIECLLSYDKQANAAGTDRTAVKRWSDFL